MFAVPGWSLAADALKSETPASANGAGPTKSRKRKRPNGGREKEEAVTADNVADLYNSVVWGVETKSEKATSDAAKRQRKESAGKPKKEKGNGAGQQDGEGRSKPVAQKKEAEDGSNKKDKDQNSKGGNRPEKKKKEKKEKKGKAGVDGGPSGSSKPDEAAAPQTASLPKPTTALTPLQASMREKLVSARFRHLNETLYTRPSEESFNLFHENPEMFDEYHQGFRRQVKVWPENPVDSFLQDIRTRAKIRAPFREKGRPNHPPSELSETALPRTAGTCIIADLGCGDARLAESLQADKDKSRLDVRSYDLQSPSPLVTRADIANLPLEDGAVDVAIFCLALMGTNWLDFIEEAYRILHWKGELWVAEIKSRFGPVRGKNAPVTHSVGNRRKAPGGKKESAARDAELQGRYEQDLAVEVDGLDDTRRETDVSAFVEALRRRGFVLQGERDEAVDLSNRMFVKMHFLKAAAPAVGKCAKEQDRPAAPKKKKMFQFEQGSDKEDRAVEASILKPCVYKIR
ncbi:25S rRNA (adenine(645)-N(1))-methyltransferase [Escovopsis weberi]|uniref:Ribosomal RNA-processing protein 8 n=1 Tax=Escovopsis weberi TaxID=150374 RepID=A0A0M8MSZ4_ESCWE|nr:25S rRNA (adenine(645)-N(1))-methyltransferase [Escovopsis weberi]